MPMNWDVVNPSGDPIRAQPRSSQESSVLKGDPPTDAEMLPAANAGANESDVPLWAHVQKEAEARTPSVSEPGPLVEDPAIKVARRFIEEQRRLGTQPQEPVLWDKRVSLMPRRRRWRS